MEGVLQRPPQPDFAAGVGIDVKGEKKKKSPMGLLRHARAKCFVKLHDFLILGNTKTSAGKVSHFQELVKKIHLFSI